MQSLVIPILEYASQVWNPHTKKNIMRLENVQLRAARWVVGSRFNRHTLKWSKSSLECHSELHWPELSIRRQYLCIVMIHDMLHGQVALTFNKFFSFASNCTMTHSLTIYCKQSTLNSYRYSFFVNSKKKVPECILKHNIFKCQLFFFLIC